MLSLIIPVYNRPDEIEELLHSLAQQQTPPSYEVVIVEDGSTVPCAAVVDRYRDLMSIHYEVVPNGGPSRARNIGARHATGDWIIILDSDVVLPPDYLYNVSQAITADQCDAWGGPDAAPSLQDGSFGMWQRAINYAMTSPLTTGGIRGGSKRLTKRFYPRTFNLGCRKALFESLGGFDETMRYGEDIDFSMRLYEAGSRVALLPEAVLYHKRRVDLRKFYRQVWHSGTARVELSRRHPGSMRLTYLLPSLFVVTTIVVTLLALWCPWFWLYHLLFIVSLFADALYRTHSVAVAWRAVVASFVQLSGYGIGYLSQRVKRCKA